ncbi:MAG TPA: V4R domain-containing protein [Anaerolineales bacterium]|nr:V4R domain-containing protein [Anaerolineales bacterium]
MSETRFSSRILRHFVEAVAVELGTDQFNAMLALAKLPSEWATSETFLRMDPIESARTYASLQAAMRAYYGRGARGVLLRVGQRLWNLLLEDAAFGDKAQAALIKRLPFPIRRRSVLELLARSMGTQSGDITVHTLDLDLLFIDHVSPAALTQQSSTPICFVTQGLIQESLFWVTKQGFDVEEISCKAMGQAACEFKITSVRET